MLKTTNLAVKFLLELAALGALAYWGATVGRGVLAVLLAIAAPAAAIIVWGLTAFRQWDQEDCASGALQA
jgi:Protein of unknown function (DUF2568)